MLDFEAEAEGASAKMGGTLHTDRRATITVRIHAIAAEGSVVHLLLDGEDSKPPLPAGGCRLRKLPLTASAGRHWLRLEVRDRNGASELISSPLYINFPEE